MPNERNITAPATLIAYGRSGTSLLQNAFRCHPDFDIAGETSELVFGVFHALQGAEGIVRGQSVGSRQLPYRERCGAAVRSAFLSMFPSQQKYWMQKPIGHSRAMDMLMRGGMSKDGYDAWYWDVMAEVFPDAKCFTILRHPCDVVLSGRQYWKRTDSELWIGLAGMASTIVHPNSRVGHAVPYEELIESPETVLRELFDYLEAPFHPAMLSALEHIWVPRRGVQAENREKHRERLAHGFSRRDEWGGLDLSAPSMAQVRVVRECWARFGRPLELPAELRCK